ncbi:centrosomal protein of 162 kDa [Melanotaenia boesemani]|uniref:centrosomal protein of 162 kDa n=1 Tax=Melanotaenia boesemani TaxID=1250792 RepID=UPI001C052DBF|nr:centrosomal protein of 162 kDa [Melanotaenia boesemani]XP_041844530.1 centrosomal protein of 162 kDa [Melanotaenia boesemani]
MSSGRMSQRLTKEELDAQFEQFLKESVSDDSLDLGGADKPPQAQSSQKCSQKPTVSWWQDDENSSEGTGGAESPKRRFIKTKTSQPEFSNGSGKSFRKSLSTSQPIQEEDEDPGDAGLSDDGREGVFLSRTGTDAQTGNMSSVGLDTLEEEEEKARFFAQLEAGASTAIDYSMLNRELDSTSPSIDTDLRKTAALRQADDGGVGGSEAVGKLPDSPHYSEDFEDEENMKELLEEEPQTSRILAGVSLYDSLDETGGQDRKDMAGSLDRGQSYGQSGGSDMEALQEAYRQIQTAQSSSDHYFSVEDRRKITRSSSPSSPPPHPPQSLQPASTTESELPTAEELMKPIRPDDIRGFSLQPASSVELNEGETSRSLQRTFPVRSRPELDRKQPEKPGAAAGIKRAWRGTSHPSSSPDPPVHDLTWRIREEVDRLMQDHSNCPTQTLSKTTKARKQPGSRGSSAFPPSVAPVRGRPALNSKSSGTSAKANSSLTRSPHHPLKTKSTKSQRNDDFSSAESGLKVSSELVASVQSLVAVLQQQMDPDAAQEVRGRHETRQISKDEDRSEVEDLRVQLAQKDWELQMMKEAAEELGSLRQQNFLLQSKLRSAEEAGQKKNRMEAADAATEERLKQIDKEMKAQETLIKGYQQENEKLYLQMKAQQARGKANEEAMFNENQRLLNELAFTREQLKKTCKPVSSLISAHHSQHISDLLAQISVLQRNEAQLSEDNHRLKQEKQSLEVDLQLVKKERDLAKAQVISTSGDMTFEMRVLEDKHREEVLTLKKKLQWFAENQELLDRDAGRLKTATAEIHQLKEQVEKLKQEVGRRSSEQQRKARDKSVDSKKMKDLERQVKELEQILRSRNPNSLPALIYAAATAGDVARASPPGRINALLERRIQRLEAELESHDEDAKRSLRTMEQQFHRIKLRYEQQISDLEQQLQQKQPVEAAARSEPWMSKCQSLEEDLRRLQENHQKKENCLREQIESLQQQLKNKAQPSPGRHQRQAEAAFGARIERLNQELATKTRSIQELSRVVERLQKERRNMLSGPNPPPESRSTETRPQPGLTRTQGSATGRETRPEETFPAAQCEKTYQPTVFTGSHISEVLQENEALKQRVDLLQLQREEEKEALKAEAVKAEEDLSRLKEHFAEQLSSMKAEHLRVLDHLRATYALEHSSSKVAELSNKLNTQEISMKHLQEQLNDLQGSKEALRVSRSREDALQKQLTRLLQELKEAKEAQSSEVKLLCSLEKKILNMELRQQHREEELQQVVGGMLQVPEADLQSEVERWRRLAQDKSRELEAFRSELDSILDILRHLQQQGVVLPTPDTLKMAPLLQNS